MNIWYGFTYHNGGKPGDFWLKSEAQAERAMMPNITP